MTTGTHTHTQAHNGYRWLVTEFNEGVWPGHDAHLGAVLVVELAHDVGEEGKGHFLGELALGEHDAADAAVEQVVEHVGVGVERAHRRRQVRDLLEELFRLRLVMVEALDDLRDEPCQYWPVGDTECQIALPSRPPASTPPTPNRR